MMVEEKQTTGTRSGSRRTAAARSGGARRHVDLLVATRKGAFVLRGDSSRRGWRIEEPHFLGHETNHLTTDPRDGTTWLLAAKTGHLGPTVFRSTDRGQSWSEARRPPAFPKAPEGQDGPAVDRVFCLAPGHASQPGVWWAGSVPHALFRSEDGGVSWELVVGFSDYLDGLRKQEPPRFFPTPGGAITHSILVDPRDPDHLYVSLSTGGCFETADAGASWRPLNQGVSADFLPDPDPEFGQDPHCMVLSPADPDRLYQQNHCGVYRLDRPRRTLGANRTEPAGRGRGRRFPHRGASAGPGHRVGLPHGRHVGLAAHGAGRPSRRLPQSRRRPKLEPWGHGTSRGARLAHGIPPSHDVRRAGPRRALSRHHYRRGLGESRRRRELATGRLASSAGACDRGARAIGEAECQGALRRCQ